MTHPIHAKIKHWEKLRDNRWGTVVGNIIHHDLKMHATSKGGKRHVKPDEQLVVWVPDALAVLVSDEIRSIEREPGGIEHELPSDAATSG